MYGYRQNIKHWLLILNIVFIIIQL